MKSLLWSDYTASEIRRIIDDENPVVIVTVGATEQHGPHLPLNTDADIAFQIAEHVAEASPIRTLILPTVWAGFSPHHMDFAGTISFKQSTLFAVVFDIIECLIKHGVTRILLVNSHGGNISLLKTVVDEIGAMYGVSPVYVTYWHLISQEIKGIRQSEMGGMSHACELETSLKMIFSPQDVRNDRIEDVMIAGNAFYSVDMFASNKIGIFKPFKDWTKTGQIGAPSKASEETGRKLLQATVNQFVELIRVQWGENRP